MFFARWEQGGPWSSAGIEGTVRWLGRLWALLLAPGGPSGDGQAPAPAPDSPTLRRLRRKLHQSVRHVTRDFETFSFNTVISRLMELANELSRASQEGAVGTPAWEEAVDVYLRLLAPVAPHLAEELWQRLGKPYSIHRQSWPQVDEEAAREEEITLVVQVNGKVRDRLTVPAGIADEEARREALASPVIQRFLAGREAAKVVVVPGRLVNVVV
jgi:leucyl-tRNA synthetase